MRFYPFQIALASTNRAYVVNTTTVIICSEKLVSELTLQLFLNDLHADPEKIRKEEFIASISHFQEHLSMFYGTKGISKRRT